MISQWPLLIALAVLGGVAALCLLGIARVTSRAAHERGHLALSVLPWVHLVLSYTVAFYVRLGFGSWPRSCIDNPDLPLIDGLVKSLFVGILIILASIPVWFGWFVIRLRRKMNRYGVRSAVLFPSGIGLIVLAHVADPWGFWSWVWD
jgi:hypothetical protein